MTQTVEKAPMPPVNLRIDTIVEDYLAGGDYSNENANMGLTPNGLLFTVGGAGLAKENLAALKHNGFGELVRLHNIGGVHIHDLTMGKTAPYCAGLAMSTLIDKGMNLEPCPSEPSKHLRSLVNHIVNTTSCVCNEISGAVAFSDVDVYMGAYAYKFYLDLIKEGVNKRIAFKLTKKEIRQSLQELTFHYNQTNRFGGQSPFTNLTLAFKCPEDLKDREASIGGKPLHTYYDRMEDGVEAKLRTYGELEEWQQLICSTFLDIFIQGDKHGKSFTFPVISINCTPDFFTDPKLATIRKKLWKLTAKFGMPFFQNFINGITSGDKKLDPRDVRSMCCRLSLDLNELRAHTGGLFGAGDSTGSLQVVTLSLPFVAKHCVENNLDFWVVLEEWMELIRDEQLWKRKQVDKSLRKGLLPACKENLPRGFSTFFTTIGFVGLWECVNVLLGYDKGFTTLDGIQLAEDVLNRMKNTVERFSKETGTLFNLESTPAESASYKLARKALKQFPDIDFRGLKSRPYFTNSHTVPAEMQDDLDLVFDTQTKLQIIPSGGTVQHFYLDHEMTEEQVEQYVKAICQTPIPFFGLNVTYSMCPICGVVVGDHEYCPNNHSEADLAELRVMHPELVEN